MSSQTLTYVLLFGPLVIGSIIALINADSVNETTEKAESWARKRHSKLSGSKNWFSKYVTGPLLWLMIQFSNWTDGFSQRGVKNGMRVALSLYIIIIWCVVIYNLIKALIFITIALAVIFVLFNVLLSGDADANGGHEAGRRVIGVAGRGQKANTKTGRVQEEGLMGWENTEMRTDPKTGKVQEEGLVTWNDTDTKVDQQSGIIKKEGLIGYDETDTRIHPETGIIQKRGLIGWENTDERIDPKTGKHQKEGLLGWIDD